MKSRHERSSGLSELNDSSASFNSSDYKNIGGTNVRLNDTSEVDKERLNKNHQFRKEIENLLKEPRSALLVYAENRCRQFNNCLEPWELISRAYLIGQKRIQNEGYTISSTEAWMRGAMFRLVREQSRQTLLDYECSISLDAPSSEYDDGQSLTLAEQVPSPIDPEHPYHKDEEESRQKSHRRMMTIYRNLKKQDRQLLKLRVIDDLSWSGVAKKMKFLRPKNSLTQRYRRLVERLKSINSNLLEEE